MTHSPDAALRDRFIGGMSHAAATVNVVTTDGPAGRGGVTVSAMSSVSADGPRPTLLVCVHHQSKVAQQIIDNGVFVVNILKDDQAYISDAFAGRFKDQLADKFDCCDWEVMASGAPRVRDPLVGFDCHVISSERVGTHHVFFGEVDDIFIADGGSPLIYARRSYGAATRIEVPGSIAAGKEAEGQRLSVGCFHTFAPILLPDMIRRMTALQSGLKIDLIEGDQRRVQQAVMAGEADLALLYDYQLPDELEAIALTELQPYVLLAHDHPLAEMHELRPADLSGQPMVLLGATPSSDFATSIMENAGADLNVAYRSASFEMVRGLVGQGLGFTILATRPASTVSYDGRLLVTRPLVVDTPRPSRVMLVSRKGARLSPQAERFRWFCKDFFDLH
ncbi:LysR substrate-binding domain-containing protein [Alisedimentitalea sp. MJ-SS2]|uniref:LysR substrate-binding domain-containing protein n=1 Tax=Aliisedimentitalea sp. MJ-SS2 TaxID=3049795 RepID=UPI0029116399|nr:LysR substrate-binding domain-containing protein [Alisedimentitalea sp. MJ-SS2]MDU8928684.1 LysR substrate-binding domain-containing protein [Alisedimentitalea sp. MJ-SS2]